jgi:hypothetical protein
MDAEAAIRQARKMKAEALGYRLAEIDDRAWPGVRPGGAMQVPCRILRLPGLRPLRITARHRSPAAGCQALGELLPQVTRVGMRLNKI